MNRPVLQRTVALLMVASAFAVVGASSSYADTPSLQPNDPAYVEYASTYTQINAELGWAATQDKPCSDTIAVLDNYVSGANPDLANAHLGANFGPGSGDTPHGTWVASAASAVTNNGVGVPGVSNCPVLSVRVLGPDERGTDDGLQAGISWACSQPGVRVLNLSLWEPAGDTPSGVNAALQACVNQGILPVLIAGNGVNDNGKGTSDPSANPLAADNPEALRVAGVDLWRDQLNVSSNYGPALADIAAPFTVPVDNPDGSWQLEGGTSYSAPLVAGVAAEMFNIKPSLTPAEVKEILVCSGTQAGLNIGSVFPDGKDCRGRILNFGDAIAAVSPAPPPPPVPKISLMLMNTGAGKGRIVTTIGTCSAQPKRCLLVSGRLVTTIRLTPKAYPPDKKYSYFFVGWGAGACAKFKKTQACVIKNVRPGGRPEVKYAFGRRLKAKAK